MRIFLSHASREKPLVREIKNKLPPFLRTWLDEEHIEWGADLRCSIRGAITEESDYVVLFLDREALQSKWVRREIDWTLERERETDQRFLLPIILEDVQESDLPEEISPRLYLRLTDRQTSSVEALASNITLRLFQLVATRLSLSSAFSQESSNDPLDVYIAGLRRAYRSSQGPMIESGLRALTSIAEVHNPFIQSQLLRNLETVISGRYIVVGTPQVYQHDREVLKILPSGSSYRATHPFHANPDAYDTSAKVPFKAYMKAQEDAAARGVDIVRIYIVPDSSSVDCLDPDQRRHLEGYKDSGIDMRVLSIEELDDRHDLSDDFVLIDDSCVGIAIPRKGAMLGSEYHCSTNDITKSIYSSYSAYFDALCAVSVPLSQVYAEGRPKSRAASAGRGKAGSPVERPAFVLRTPVNVDGRHSERLMVVLRTNGCHYDKGNSGCTMCDFKRHAVSSQTVRPEWLMDQLRTPLSETVFGQGSVEQIDLLTLGSFLHDREVPGALRRQAFHLLRDTPGLQKIVIESRSPYVAPRKLEALRRMLRDDQSLELGLGVETTNEMLRNEVIKKGLSERELERVVQACGETGVSFMPYLLIGTMTLSDDEAVADAVQSAHEIADLCNRYRVPFRLAFEPVFITHDTELEAAFQNGEYHLISLWRVIDVIKQTHHLGTVFVGLSDEGLADNRLPAGCENCTERLRNAIESYNGSQDLATVAALDCNCRA